MLDNKGLIELFRKTKVNEEILSSQIDRIISFLDRQERTSIKRFIESINRTSDEELIEVFFWDFETITRDAIIDVLKSFNN